MRAVGRSPFTVGERTAIVAGVRAGLLVRTPTKSSYAQAPQRAALARVQSTERGGEEGAPWLPAELAAARAEILRAQERLSGLSAELDKAARGEPSAPLKQLRSEIEEIQTDDRWRHRDPGAGTLRLRERAAGAVGGGQGRRSSRPRRGPMRFGFGAVPIIQDRWQ